MEDDRRAIALWIKAAESGSIQAQDKLSLGGGDLLPDSEVARWLPLAAGRGNLYAQLRLARNYRNGEKGFGEDNAQAYFWYSMALQNKLCVTQSPPEKFSCDMAIGQPDVIDDALTAEQIEAQQKRLREWKLDSEGAKNNPP